MVIVDWSILGGVSILLECNSLICLILINLFKIVEENIFVQVIEDRWIKSQLPVKMPWPFCLCLILQVGVR